MKTTLFTHVTVAFSCCLATFTACAGPETEIDPIGNAPVTALSRSVGETAKNGYSPFTSSRSSQKMLFPDSSAVQLPL